MAGAAAHAKFDPSVRWETVRSDHFRVHAPPTYREFVKRLTAHLEEAYGILSRELGWTLSEAVEVVVRSDTDLPNGVASVFPMNRLEIHAVPFLPVSSLGEYDDWIRTLAFHELTHILANDTTGGWVDAIRAVFGSVGKLNSFQPRWVMEGLATYVETAHGKAGRGRSAFADMVFRTAARHTLIDGAHPGLGVTLDRLNDGVPEWPGGTTSYLYGYLMNAMLVRAGGAEAPARASIASARRLPFMVDSVAREVAGQDYEELWQSAAQTLDSISRADLERLRQHPVSQASELTESGRWTRGPAISPDGRTVHYIRDSYRDGLGLSALDLASGRTSRLTRWRWPAGARLRPVGGGGGLLYSRIRQNEEYRFYSDLHLWDLKAGRELRITLGARAWDPDASPDFGWSPESGVTAGALVCVKNLDDGNQAIVLMSAAGERILHRGQEFERFSLPVWGRGASEGWVLFSSRETNQGERIRAVRLDRPSDIRNITPGLPMATTPALTASGDLLFAGGASGVQNIYRVPAARLSGILRREEPGGGPAAGDAITNLETGALFPLEWKRPGVDEAEAVLLAAVFGPRGYDLGLVPVQPNASPPKLKPLHEKLLPDSAAESPASGASGNDRRAPKLSPGTYSVFPALWPKYWLLNGRVVADGVEIGASTGGHDALERHHYTLLAAWDSRADFPVYTAEYRYEGLYPSIQISRQQLNKYVGELRRNNRVESNRLTLVYPIGDWTVGFGATQSTSRFLADTTSGGGLLASFAHAEFEADPDSIDPSSGDSGHSAGIAFAAGFAGVDQYPSVEAYWEQRIRSPVDRHFIRLLANGAYSGSDSLSALFFVGGGEETISSEGRFLIRGYRPGMIYGRSIATLNAEYWLPLKDIFGGEGTLPVFNRRTKLRLLADTGSAEYLGRERTRFSRWPVGVGAHLLHDLTVLYHFPATVSMGLNVGLDSGAGGETQLVFGLSTGLFGD